MVMTMRYDVNVLRLNRVAEVWVTEEKHTIKRS